MTLRDVAEADAAIHAAYPPEPEIVRMYGGDPANLPERSFAASRDWVAWMQAQPYARIIERDGTAVGHLRLHSLSVVDGRARLGIGLFSSAFLGQGIGRRAIVLALDDAFGPLGLHRVDLRVLATNTRAIRCYESCGFVHECTERDAACVEGSWVDDWIMSILAREHEARRQDGDRHSG
ncbi:GNAT family N-acetyltransferase [Pelagovum pacificum]|uniref:GNAT family N-acetyltransferase n=1 Tax=Pelagovum pacificum TaxID=2588711 RepID=UPI001E631A00|nr:GNAT family protein [Pelagovum pacificum]